MIKNQFQRRKNWMGQLREMEVPKFSLQNDLKEEIRFELIYLQFFKHAVTIFI